MRLAGLMLKAIHRELGHVHRRGGRDVHVDVKRGGPNELVGTVSSTLDGKVEIQRFVCWERVRGGMPIKRIVWARPETTIVARCA